MENQTNTKVKTQKTKTYYKLAIDGYGMQFKVSYYDDKKKSNDVAIINDVRSLVNNQVLYILKYRLGFAYYNKYVRNVKIEKEVVIR